ncbi:hypothetical protein, partial [Streptomyces sp. NPDC054838]
MDDGAAPDADPVVPGSVGGSVDGLAEGDDEVAGGTTTGGVAGLGALVPGAGGAGLCDGARPLDVGRGPGVVPGRGCASGSPGWD